MAIVCQTCVSCSRPCIYSPALPLGKLRIENYDFCNLKLTKLLLLVKNHNKKFELAGFLLETGKKENILVRKRNKKFRLAGFC